MLKKTVILIIGIFSCVFFVSDAQERTVMQYSTISALSKGVFDGDYEINNLKKYGDFGLGTFNALDGEMLFLNGNFFQILVDGTACKPADNTKTPFATVCFFKPDKEIKLPKNTNYEALKKEIVKFLPSMNSVYAVMIDGTFTSITTRSVPAQKKPYPSLALAVESQKTQKMINMKGYAVGFYFPEYMKELNVSGLHVHFIASDKKKGGHVLDFTTDSVSFKFMEAKDFYMILPSEETARFLDSMQVRESEKTKEPADIPSATAAE